MLMGLPLLTVDYPKIFVS